MKTHYLIASFIPEDGDKDTINFCYFECDSNDPEKVEDFLFDALGDEIEISEIIEVPKKEFIQLKAEAQMLQKQINQKLNWHEKILVQKLLQQRNVLPTYSTVRKFHLL